MNLKVNAETLKKLLLRNTTPRQTVIKNTFWLGFGNVASRLVKGLIIIYAARVLGTEGYGVFSYAVSLAGFLTVLADIGITAIVTREASRHPDELRSYLGTGFVMKVILAALNMIPVFVIAPLITRVPEALPLLPLAGLLVVSDSLRDFTFAHARAKEKMEREGIISILTNAAITAFGAAALLLSRTPKTLLVGYVAGSGVGFLVSLWAIRRDLGNPLRSFDWKIASRFLRDGWSFSLFGVLSVFMINTDTVMLGWFSNAHELGLYAAAQRPIQLLQIAPTIMSTAFFPVLARLAGRDGPGFRRVVEITLSAALAAALPLVAGGVLLAPQITRLLFGPAYDGAAPMFALLAATLILTFSNAFIANAVFAHNKQRLFIKFAAAGAIANIVLNALFIPRAGGTGAALATLLTQAMAVFLMWRSMKSLTEFSVIPRLARAAAATAGMGAAVLALRALDLPVLLIVAAGGMIYAAILAALKEPLLRALSPRELLAATPGETASEIPVTTP